MHRPSKDALRLSAAILAAVVFAGALVVGVHTRRAEAGNFAITSITASCDGTGLVYFTGDIPEGGFTLELMDKAPDDSGPFIPTSPATIITITSGVSPVDYVMPLGNWSPPHYRVDSNFSTKSPSLFCEAASTETPQPTATNTVTPTASATQTQTASATHTAISSVTSVASSTSTPTTVVSTSTPGNTVVRSATSSSGGTAATSTPTGQPTTAAVNTVLALARPPVDARLPSALPNTGDGAGWTRVVLPPALGVLALGLLVAVLGSYRRRSADRRHR